MFPDVKLSRRHRVTRIALCMLLLFGKRRVMPQR